MLVPPDRDDAATNPRADAEVHAVEDLGLVRREDDHVVLLSELRRRDIVRTRRSAGRRRRAAADRPATSRSTG